MCIVSVEECFSPFKYSNLTCSSFRLCTSDICVCNPVAAMYVDPIVLIFSTLLNRGFDRSWKNNNKKNRQNNLP